MGASYSDLYVYFHSRNPETYSGNGYTVTVTQENFDGCCNFVVCTHKININYGNNSLSYNVLLYDGYDDKHKGNYVFGYYYPRNENEVIEEVRCYYSILVPDDPLVISFVTKNKQNYNCLPGVLNEAWWDRAYNITGYTIKKPIKDQLDEEFNKKSRKRKIKFAIGKTKVDIFGDKQELGNKKSYRFIFIPNGDVSVLGSDYLFAIDFNKNEPICSEDPNPEVPRDCKRLVVYTTCITKGKKTPEYCKNNLNSLVSQKPVNFTTRHQNKIDEYFLHPFDGQLYDGIIVYFDKKKERDPKTFCGMHEYNNNTALLLEFIDSSKEKTYLKRKDKDGYCWVEESVKYTSDIELSKELGQIKERLDMDVVTVIIDEKRKYNGLQEFVEADDKNQACTKYTYKFNAANKPIIIFGRKTIKIGTSEISIQVKDVEVYYLNARGTEDKQPFLIVFDPSEGKDDKKKAYHFTNTDKFEEWKEFEYHDETTKKKITEKDVVDKLYERVGRIEKNLKCVEDLNILRSMAYEILIGKDPKPPEIKKETPPQRPPEQQPPTTTEPLSIPLIAGCTVGGGVFVISSAVGYGIYWYNTTIKLLT